MSTNRDTLLDSLKYWLIILVIIGHVFVICGGDNKINQVTWHWIYIFHMPLFIFISGYLSHKKTNREFLKSSWKILEPFVIFQVIARGIDALEGEPITLINLLTPRYVLWYLLSLFFWRLILQTLPNKILNNTTLVLISTFIISVLAGFLPFNNFLSLQRTFAFLPFFFMGYYMRGKNLFLPSKYKTLYLCLFIITIAIPIFFSNYLGDVFRINPYDGIEGAYKRVFAFVISIPMSILFMSICPNFQWTAKQGRFTLQYFIYHAFLVKLLLILINKFSLPTSFTYLLIYTLAIVISLGLASYIPYFDKFTNLISFLRERIYHQSKS